MTFMYIASLIITGYDGLPPEARVSFEASSAGKLFTKLVQDLLELEHLKDSFSLWQRLSGVAAEREQDFQDELESKKRELIERLKGSDEYKNLIAPLVQNVLQKEVDGLKFLPLEQQKLLSQTDFAQSFYATLTAIDQSIKEEKSLLEKMRLWDKVGPLKDLRMDFINDLQTQREETIRLWKVQFMERADMELFRKAIESNKESIHQAYLAKQHASLDERAKALSLFFPLLNYRKFKIEAPIINQLRSKYIHENGEFTEAPDKVDEEQIADLLFYCMKEVSQAEINFMTHDLDRFNKEQAKRMASAVLHAFSEKSALNLDAWFQEYESNLCSYIIEKLKLVNSKEWKAKQIGLKEGLLSSLSYLWNNPAVGRANEFVRKLAEAHAFIQATGFSTQNESSLLAILDMYNYGRHHEQIAETRSIFLSLLSPFYPLFNEYKDIALYEKNNYWKLFRTVMPLVIIVSFIILVATVLVPLVLPELAFVAAFIPSFLVGLGLATEYVSTKNAIYNSLRELYFGGSFEIPEFQVTPRMIKSFGTPENAEKVRAFYIDAIKLCDALENNLYLKHEQGILSQEELDQRKANKEKRQKLCLEWYDIHSNKDLSYEEAPAIVLNRLQQASDQEYQTLEKALQKELDSISKSVSEVTTDIKAVIAQHNKMPVFEDGAEKEDATTIKANYRYGLFGPPNCLKVKDRLEKLDQFRQQIEAQCVATC